MSSVTYVDRIDLRFSDKPWRFAQERRAEIDAHFKSEKAKNASLWDGRLFLMHECKMTGGLFRGAYFETGFAELLAWRDWEFPDKTIRNCYAQAALRGSDGHYVLGVMSANTVNAGQVYFPSGTPERADLVGDRVDLDGSAARELYEETGLDVQDFEVDPGWYVVEALPRIAMMKVMQSRETAGALGARILENLKAQKDAELSGIYIARGPDDIDPRMPDYVSAFLRHVWRA
jgi:hypothetical protein